MADGRSLEGYLRLSIDTCLKLCRSYSVLPALRCLPCSLVHSPITPLGPVTSGTFAGLVLVLHSCHEEICGCRAVAGHLCRSGLRHLAVSQKAAEGSARSGASPNPAPDESEIQEHAETQDAEASHIIRSTSRNAKSSPPREFLRSLRNARTRRSPLSHWPLQGARFL